MEFLVVVVLGAATAWAVTRMSARRQIADYRASRGKAVAKKAASGKRGGLTRHAVGYWAGEALHGFPVARTGWHAGWLAHRTARDQQRAVREEARTTHLETRASFLSSLKDHRKRQARAQAEIDKALAAAPEPVRGRKAVQEAATNVLPFRPREAQAVPPLPADTVPVPAAPTRRVDGQPETEADKRFFDERESGYTGPLDQDGHRPDMTDPQARHDVEILNALGERTGGNGVSGMDHGVPTVVHESAEYDTRSLTQQEGTQTQMADDRWKDTNVVLPHLPDPRKGTPAAKTQSQQAQPRQEGNRMASDVNYRQVLDSTKRAVAQSDQNSASIQQQAKEAYDLADQMSAANVDPSVISEQMNHAEALDRAAKELAQAGEHATNTSHLAQQYHGQMQEAHDDAPGKVAERSFHES